MPYFHNDKVNILFIHIPKTGGSSVEKYFSIKFDIPLQNKSLYNKFDKGRILPDGYDNRINLQHQTYQEIMKYKNYLKVDTNNLQIISIVRSPYDKIISDLFYEKFINFDTSKEEVYNIFKDKYLKKKNLDNHNLPQYKFLTDENEKLINAKILRTENLKKDMEKLGYKDFDYNMNVNKQKIDYDNYLNEDTIKLINKVYCKDFEIFGFKKR